jgi:hypothetical protein
VRNTARPPIAPGNAPVSFTIGPVDFPDTAGDQAATGARFLDHVRGYSGNSVDDVEHYCLDCTFRPWLDATGRVSATVVFHTATGDVTEDVAPHDGQFVTTGTLAPGETADVTITDAWGDTSGDPVTIRG